MANIDVIFLVAASLVLMLHGSDAVDSNTTNSYGCGVFFASDENKAPRAKVYIVPARYPIEDCSNPDVEAYKSRCYTLMKNALFNWEYSRASRVREGSTVGKDLCRPISRPIRKPGLQLGFYFAYCDSEWFDTGLRKPEPLCCTKRIQVEC